MLERVAVGVFGVGLIYFFYFMGRTDESIHRSILANQKTGRLTSEVIYLGYNRWIGLLIGLPVGGFLIVYALFPQSIESFLRG